MGFAFETINDQPLDELKTLFMQEVVKRRIYFVWNMLPSYVTADEDIDTALEAFEDSLRICVAAEKEGNIKDKLEGKIPLAVI